MSNKACIGYCDTGMIHSGFAASLMQLIWLDRAGPQVISDILIQGGPYIALNRNLIVDRFLKEEAQVLVFMDYDIVFTPEDFGKLLEASTEHPIVAGRYRRHSENEGESLRDIWSPMPGDHTGPVVPLKHCGMGFTAIRREVLEKIHADNPGEPWKWFGHDACRMPSGSIGRAGEDVSFSLRALKSGFPIVGRADIHVGHIKSSVLM